MEDITCSIIGLLTSNNSLTIKMMLLFALNIFMLNPDIKLLRAVTKSGNKQQILSIFYDTWPIFFLSNAPPPGNLVKFTKAKPCAKAAFTNGKYPRTSNLIVARENW